MNKRRIGYAIMVFSLILCFVVDAAMAGTLPRFEWPFGGIVVGGNPSNSQVGADGTGNTDISDDNDVTESDSEPEVKPEDLEPVQPETKKAINDMTKAFNILLERGTRKFYEGYPVDDTFLHWVNKECGEAVILDLAYRLYEGYDSTALWYYHTGSTMHVLWLQYCKDLQFATYYLDNVKWLDCASDVVTLDFTGDINLADDWHTMQAAATKPNGIYDCIAPEITKELQSADLSVINNEFVFSARGEPLAGKAYTFRAKTSNVSMLELFGADVANLANNHVFDFGADSLMDTIATLENAGITTMGAGANIKEASEVQYFVANGKKISLVTATQIERYSNYTKEATETTPGVLKTKRPERYYAVIREAAANSDYVIANIHWGTEGRYNYAADQTTLAKGFVEAGADVIIGGHPHRLQGVEYVENVPVMFSLGNFWFSTGTLYTMIAQVQIDAAGEVAVRTIPCIQKDLTTSMLSAEESDAFYKFMADISKNVVIDKDGYFYNTAGGQNADMKDGINYQSGMRYDTYNGGLDLEGRPIDIVGNLR